MNLQIVIPFINFYLVIFKINLQFKKSKFLCNNEIFIFDVAQDHSFI